MTHRSRSPLRGKAGLPVAYWLCAHPDEALSPTGHSADLGFAPSTISTAAAALAEAGLVDDGRQAVLPELFWELAGTWRPRWTWLAGRPDRIDQAEAWALTGDRVAAAQGAPLVSAGVGPLELSIPDPVTITVAERRYGVAPPGAGAAAVAVAPVRQVLTGERRLDGWRTALDLAVAPSASPATLFAVARSCRTGRETAMSGSERGAPPVQLPAAIAVLRALPSATADPAGGPHRLLLEGTKVEVIEVGQLPPGEDLDELPDRQRLFIASHSRALQVATRQTVASVGPDAGQATAPFAIPAVPVAMKLHAIQDRSGDSQAKRATPAPAPDAAQPVRRDRRRASRGA